MNLRQIIVVSLSSLAFSSIVYAQAIEMIEKNPAEQTSKILTTIRKGFQIVAQSFKDEFIELGLIPIPIKLATPLKTQVLIKTMDKVTNEKRTLPCNIMNVSIYIFQK